MACRSKFVLVQFGFLLAACGSGSQVCTLVGAVSAIHVTAADGIADVEYCVDGACQPLDPASDGQFLVDDQPSSYELVARGVAADGSRFESSASVATEELSPNGPDCDPHVAVAYVMVEADGSISVS